MSYSNIAMFQCNLNVVTFVALQLSQVIIERAGRNDGGTYECWDTVGEAASISKQVCGGSTNETLPEAQRTQGIASKT